MAPAEIEGRIHLLTIPTPFPVGPVNVYLLDGEPLTLVDVGPLTDEALDALKAGLHGLGHSLSDVEQVVITHAHHDHFGLAREVLEVSGARLLSFHMNTYPLEHFYTWWDQRVSYVADLVVKEGAPPDSVQEVEIIRSFGQYAAPIPQIHPLLDGQLVQMGDASWRALHTPGHAIGHLCFYQEESKLLLSGDHLLRDITSNPVLETPRLGMAERPRSLPDYVRSLRHIRELDVSKVLPGHGEPVYDHRPLVDEILRHHEERASLILHLLEERDRTVYELGLALFGGRLPGVDLFLVMSEIIGHLDILELEGKARRVERNGRGVWTAAHVH
jgi:glyoxylase-like metal-dependent hydrolase (beta-lactamase superfamily II)